MAERERGEKQNIWKIADCVALPTDAVKTRGFIQMMIGEASKRCLSDHHLHIDY
ncbi:hypothetical protein JCM10914A_18760 [Paenibacillus sp. JCM 10914]|uniref:hypothetical protein n=1 Tax=Paenibacillus sp. JCM 10914 TaxID=1236974 RepID=UPI0003CC4E70|nr:hypothetical protein [Paenibacillus sp. JCM 10914]GAE06251.1 hypothetical protein JCM10914_2398 [Paenibacillus sp. JCM 10914]